VHCQIDTPGDQCRFYLLGEQALAADFGEQAVLHPVASRVYGDDLDCPRLSEVGMGGCQAVGDESGLAQRHRAAAGTDAERAKGYERSPGHSFQPAAAVVPNPRLPGRQR
jgi:hypothetical protein